MKKKMIALMMALCVMCGLFAACDSESTADVINEAVKKTQALDSMAGEMKMQTDMAMEGMTLSIPVTAEIKAKGLQGENPISSTKLSMSMLGQDIDLEMYQEGDWAYIAMEDMKYKTNVSAVESEYDYTDDMNSMLQELPADLLKDVKLVKNEDGSQKVSISISDEQFAELYKDFIEKANAESAAASEIKISDATVSITVAKGYVSVYDMEFTMTMVADEMNATVDVKATVSYQDPGKEVTITPPAGYQDFEEMDMGDLAA